MLYFILNVIGVGSVGIVGTDDLFYLSVYCICLFSESFFVRYFWSESCGDDTLCHVLSACLLFTCRHGNRMWVRLWLLSLVSLRTRIVSAEMLGRVLQVLECLGSVLEAPWERLGLSWRLSGSLADLQTI